MPQLAGERPDEHAQRPDRGPRGRERGHQQRESQPRLAAPGSLHRDRDAERDREQAAEDDARDRGQDDLLDDSALGPARPRESRPITFSSRSSAIAPAASSTPTKHSETASA